MPKIIKFIVLCFVVVGLVACSSDKKDFITTTNEVTKLLNTRPEEEKDQKAFTIKLEKLGKLTSKVTKSKAIDVKNQELIKNKYQEVIASLKKLQQLNKEGNSKEYNKEVVSYNELLKEVASLSEGIVGK